MPDLPVTLIVAVLVSLALVVASNTCLESALPPHPLLKTRAINITPRGSVRWVPPFVNALLKSLLSQTKQSALVSITRDTEKGKDPSPARSETLARSSTLEAGTLLLRRLKFTRGPYPVGPKLWFPRKLPLGSSVNKGERKGQGLVGSGT